ncbi:hypothetical protein [Streptomyces coeruleorubidus]|uniref:Uncharacterized protein n=1 Tax=Streptomyces coeruleorubidus TaxID=116188 RepID=A0ABZ0KN55_STRC4|nr:hypothetical protein [Streptomyces coeruleorubidus]WOT39363.1 hypothetical protein R5U08_36755 [Streptomyces coeruleorubidus]
MGDDVQLGLLVQLKGVGRVDQLGPAQVGPAACPQDPAEAVGGGRQELEGEPERGGRGAEPGRRRARAGRRAVLRRPLDPDDYGRLTGSLGAIDKALRDT